VLILWIALGVLALVVLVPLSLLLAFLLLAPTLEKVDRAQAEAPYHGGSASVSPARVVAGSDPLAICVSYSVGPEGIRRGGGIRLFPGRLLRFGHERWKLCMQWGSEWGILQRRHPDRQNYLEVVTGRDNVALDVSLVENFSRREPAAWARRKILQKLGFRLEKFNPKDAFIKDGTVTVMVADGNLMEGDTIEFNLGRGAGLKVPGAPLETDFALAVDSSGEGAYRLEASVPTVRVTGGAPCRIDIVAPSRAAPGERVGLLVRFLDSSGFLTPEFSGPVTLSAPEGIEVPDSLIVPGDNEGAVRVEAVVRGAGVARIHAVSSDGRLEGGSNPIICEEGAYRLLWGDTHTHSVISDATMEPAYLYHRARDLLGWDFTCVAEHDFWSTAEEYPRSPEELELMVRSAGENYRPGEFVTFPAYEWTEHRQGHRNVVFGPGEQVEFLTHVDTMYATPERLLEALNGRKAIVIPHHPAWKTHAGEMRFNYGPVGNPLQRLVEVYSRHGSSEYYRCPKQISHFALLEGARGKMLRFLYREYAGPESGSYVRDALAAGHRLGLIAGSDEHLGGADPRRTWAYVYGGGITGVFCKAATREAAWEGLWSRRVCATTGPRIFMEMLVNGQAQGSELRVDSSPRITGRVVGTTDLERVELVKFDGESYSVPWQGGGGGRESLFDFTDEGFRSNSFYYLRVIQADGHIGWAGPTWADR